LRCYICASNEYHEVGTVQIGHASSSSFATPSVIAHSSKTSVPITTDRIVCPDNNWLISDLWRRCEQDGSSIKSSSKANVTGQSARYHEQKCCWSGRCDLEWELSRAAGMCAQWTTVSQCQAGGKDHGRPTASSSICCEIAPAFRLLRCARESIRKRACHENVLIYGADGTRRLLACGLERSASIGFTSEQDYTSLYRLCYHFTLPACRDYIAEKYPKENCR